MKTFIRIFTILFILLNTLSYGQTARVKGVILDETNSPVDEVNIATQGKNTKTNENGFYELTIPANQKIQLVFTHTSLKKSTVTLELKPNEDYELNVVMNSKAESLGEVIVLGGNKRRVQGITVIEPEVIRRIPGANAGIENILKTLPGVYSNNELSTQYAVRGGNYDENLVYVNEIEVYRPFLVRSGQQEGLSFTNTDLVQNVDFSGGGFQAKYGDKLSSVLDITYRRPTKFGVIAEASFLGGSVAVDAVSKNQKWSAITGFRYRDNSLLVNSQETETNFRPTFLDPARGHHGLGTAPERDRHLGGRRAHAARVGGAHPHDVGAGRAHALIGRDVAHAGGADVGGTTRGASIEQIRRGCRRGRPRQRHEQAAAQRQDARGRRRRRGAGRCARHRHAHLIRRRAHPQRIGRAHAHEVGAGRHQALERRHVADIAVEEVAQTRGRARLQAIRLRARRAIPRQAQRAAIDHRGQRAWHGWHGRGARGLERGGVGGVAVGRDDGATGRPGIRPTGKRIGRARGGLRDGFDGAHHPHDAVERRGRRDRLTVEPHLQPTGTRGQREPRDAREHVTLHAVGEPGGVGHGEVDAIPHVGRVLTGGGHDEAATRNASGRGQEGMRVRVVVEVHAPTEGAGGHGGGRAVGIGARAGNGHRHAAGVERARGRRRDRGYWRQVRGDGEHGLVAEQVAGGVGDVHAEARAVVGGHLR